MMRAGPSLKEKLGFLSSGTEGVCVRNVAEVTFGQDFLALGLFYETGP